MCVLESHPEPAEWTAAHRELVGFVPPDHRGQVRPFWSVAYVVTEDVDGAPSGVREVRTPFVTDARGGV